MLTPGDLTSSPPAEVGQPAPTSLPNRPLQELFGPGVSHTSSHNAVPCTNSDTTGHDSAQRSTTPAPSNDDTSTTRENTATAPVSSPSLPSPIQPQTLQDPLATGLDHTYQTLEQHTHMESTNPLAASSPSSTASTTESNTLQFFYSEYIEDEFLRLQNSSRLLAQIVRASKFQPGRNSHRLPTLLPSAHSCLHLPSTFRQPTNGAPLASAA